MWLGRGRHFCGDTLRFIDHSSPSNAAAEWGNNHQLVNALWQSQENLTRSQVCWLFALTRNLQPFFRNVRHSFSIFHDSNQQCRQKPHPHSQRVPFGMRMNFSCTKWEWMPTFKWFDDKKRSQILAIFVFNCKHRARLWFFANVLAEIKHTWKCVLHSQAMFDVAEVAVIQ